jgi:chromosome segregation ATPase
VIESIMFFALGFLAAALIALLFFPALNTRAMRLARRRIEAQFPLSISELTAEKDHLRAEFAILQRRLERKAEEGLAVKQQSMEELGRRAVRIETLETDVAERDRRINGLEADLADTRQRLAATEEELAGTRQTLARVQETLTALETAHRATLDALDTARSERDATEATLAETRGMLATAEESLERRQAEHADLERRHTESLNEIDTRRITISDLETCLATQAARGNELERALAEGRDELTAERRRLADLARNLVSEQERGLAFEQRVRTLEAERTTLEEERAQAIVERDALRHAAKRAGDKAPDSAELRRRIDEVADEIMRAADKTREPAQSAAE